VPVGAWRSVGSSHNAFVVECFLDEIAAAGRRDPLALRLELLKDDPRLGAVVELAARKAGWGESAPAGRARGLAAHASFGSFVAQVAEVSVARDGAVQVHRVVCAVDCGQTVNPDTIEAQMEGAVAFGLTATLKGAITIEHGRVRETGFGDYPLLHIGEMPQVEVHIVPSDKRPGGIGEPGVPCVAPAVANAIFAACGKRVRRLPITPAELARG
jgi:isoquinoline 1-oxidoreductase beta subunit